MQTEGTPIAWPLRAWFFAELLFALMASTSFGLFPAQTGDTAAWNLKPEVMAAVLGAFYLSAGSVSVTSLLARRWEMVRVIVLPLIVFTLFETIVTVIHWDRFNSNTFAFAVWLASYVLPPPIMAACYFWHQGRAGPHSFKPTEPLPSWMRSVLLVAGVLLILEALFTLFRPEWITSSAPWQFTPLSARVFAGFMLGIGAMMLSIARENDRDRVRLASPFLVISLPAALVQVSRFPSQVDWSHPRLWIFTAILAVACFLGVELARGSWRRSLG